MRCIAPIAIDSPHRIYTQEVPCGRCYSCLQNRRNEWTFRLVNELRVAESGYFVTLTYEEEKIPKTRKWSMYDVGTLVKEDLQKFNKRIRSEIMMCEEPDGRWLKKSEKTENWSPKYRYFGCGEYGSRGDRPHYHILMFNLPHNYVDYDNYHKEMYSKKIEGLWGKGIVHIGNIEQASCHYVAKYTLGDLITEEGWDEHGDPRLKPFAIMSRKPGIGLNYADEQIKNYFNRTKNSYATVENNVKQRLGRYYKDKIFTDEQVRAEVESRTSKFARAQELRQENEARAAGRDITEIRRDNYTAAVRKIKRTIKKGKL